MAHFIPIDHVGQNECHRTDMMESSVSVPMSTHSPPAPHSLDRLRLSPSHTRWRIQQICIQLSNTTGDRQQVADGVRDTYAKEAHLRRRRRS